MVTKPIFQPAQLDIQSSLADAAISAALLLIWLAFVIYSLWILFFKKPRPFQTIMVSSHNGKNTNDGKTFDTPVDSVRTALKICGDGDLIILLPWHVEFVSEPLPIRKEGLMIAGIGAEASYGRIIYCTEPFKIEAKEFSTKNLHLIPDDNQSIIEHSRKVLEPKEFRQFEEVLAEKGLIKEQADGEGGDFHWRRRCKR